MRIAILFGLFTLAMARISYNGYQVIRIEVAHQNANQILDLIEQKNLDFLAAGKNWMDVLVSPEHSTIVQDELIGMGLSSNIYIEDVQPLIERDYAAMDGRKEVKADLDFSVYNSFEDIEAYLADLPAQDNRTSLRSIGQSVEGRDLWQLTISVGEGKQPVWFDCGIHAREWISPATCLWGINYLLTGYGTDPDATALLDAYDVLIMPVNNPDGYVYTQTDRMWRKNRAVYPENLCIGVDLNRNFDNNFGGPGSSNNSCIATYCGPSPASEPEIAATQAAINEIASTAAALYSLHSYSQFWMYAYANTTDLPPDAAELDAVSAVGVEALTAVHGTSFEYGTWGNLLYLSSGITADYAYAKGITNSFTLELRDTGEYGFLLPEEQILPTAEETWAGLIAATLSL